MSYEVPSDARDQRILRKQNEDLRNIIRIVPQSTNENTDGGGFDGLAGASGINSGYLTGSFVITSPEEQQAVKISWTSGRSVTGKRLLHVGDYVATNAGITGTNWIGRVTYITTTESDVSGTCICEPQLKKFNKPSDGARSAFNSGSTTSLTKIKWVASSTGGEGDWAEYANSDEDYDDRWTATYNASGFSNQEVVISTGSMIIDNREGGTDVEIKNILGNLKDGQMLTVKPKDGMTLTLKTGGNIDGDNETVIKDTDIAILQYHEDGGSKWRAVGGSGDGLSTVVKEPCRVASTGNNALHPVYNVTIDGVTLVEGDRLLIKNQTTQRDNGIYVCGGVTLGASTFTRAEDFDEDSEVKSGVLVAVNEGTDNGNTLWALTSDGNLTVGTSALVFTKMTVDSSLDYTWSGKNLYVNATEWSNSWNTDAYKQTNCQVKFQGDGLEHSGYSDNASQRVLEIGKYGTHEVKIIAEITGEGDAVISDPDGGGNFTIPNSDPSVSFKSCLVMNTYDIYDLDKLVFAQGDSSTAPPMLNNWVGIQANTGEDTTGGSNPPNPVLNGMALHVPDDKKFFFKIGKGTTGEEAEGSNVHDAFKVSENGIEIGSSSVPSSLSNGMIWHNSSDNKVYVRSNGATVEVGAGGVQLTDNPTWTGKHVWDTTSTWLGSYDTDSEKATNCRAKFQGDGLRHQTYNSGTGVWDWDSGYSDDSTQRVLEIGKYGSHEVKIIAEVTGEGDAIITDPDGTGSYTIPNSDPSISMKACLVMNTYTMYDLDTVVFSQGASTTTPAPLGNWVWIEANTGTSGSPSLTGMHYNVPTSKTHQFKINLAEKFNISSDGIKLSSNSTPSSPSNGMIWLDSGDNKVYARSNGASVEVGGSGGGGSWVGTATTQLNMGTHSIKGAWGGTSNTLGIQSDLDMNTYDINDADRIKFSTTQGTGSSLGSSDYGIETAYNSGTAYGMTFRIPASAFFYFNSGSSQLLYGDTTGLVTTEPILGGSLKTTSFVDFDNISSPSNPATNHVKLFADSDNSDHLTVRKPNGSEVDLEAGGGGVQLSDNNIWTGTNRFNGAITGDFFPVGTGANLGSTSNVWTAVFAQRFRFDSSQRYLYNDGDDIKYVLNDSSGLHKFYCDDDYPILQLDDENVIIRTGRRIKSAGSSELGYYVTNATSTVGSQGTQQLPHKTTSVTNPSDTVLDGYFGSEKGCSGVTEVSGTLYLWIRMDSSSSGRWKKVTLS